MKMRKMTAAALAAVIAAVSVSAVSFAETDEIREDSKYEITLEKEIVDGEEKAAVIFKGLPKEAFTFNYAHTHETILGKHNGKNVIQVRRPDFNGVRVIIGDNDSQLRFFYINTYKDELDKYIFEWEASNNPYSDNQETYPMTFKEDGDTITLTAYLDLENAILKDLSTEEKVVATTYVDLFGGSISCYDDDNDGHISDDEEKFSWISVGDCGEYVPIYSNEKIALHTSDKLDATAKERVKITNNLNAPAESDPTESTGVPGNTDKTSDSEDKQEIIDATLKNVDSKNGIEGEALDKLLFGDSGWTWGQVEKIEFSSEKLFSVQYKNDNGDWVKLGDEAAARAAADGIWNTTWTLDTSEMAKDNKYAKVIAKDGTADITVKIYINKDAEKPSDGSDQKSTGIALAIAPVVLAAGAVIVISKKRK